jgi:hypothetical protein
LPPESGGPESVGGVVGMVVVVGFGGGGLMPGGSGGCVGALTGL